jgi:hypothetical protein
MGKHGKDPSEGLIFGLLLVSVGVLFLLNRMDVVSIGDIWDWWPLLFIGLGAMKIVMWRSAESVASGLGMTMFGLWFLVSERGWFGLSWSDSWPLALVAIGLSMVARAALEPLFRGRGANAPEGERHA